MTWSASSWRSRPSRWRGTSRRSPARTGQYIFISSASVYEKPARHYVITEKTPTVNPYWEYSQRKIACEALLKAQTALPWTIVRPSHTVRTGLPTMLNEGDIVGHRMLAGRPVIVTGDGTSPWTLTRSADFAVPFVGLFGKPGALGEDFHITSDRGYTWDAIYTAIARGLGVKAEIVHVPTDTLVRYHPAWEGPLTRRQDLGGALRQFQGQAGRRSVHVLGGPRRGARRVDRPLQGAAEGEGAADERPRSAHRPDRAGTVGARAALDAARSRAATRCRGASRLARRDDRAGGRGEGAAAQFQPEEAAAVDRAGHDEAARRVGGEAEALRNIRDRRRG